jgi:hypothetical protein
MKIIKLSKTGFQLENKKWFTFDKFKCKGFDVLNVGDVLENIVVNNKGFVTSFSVSAVSGVEGLSSLNKVNSKPSPLSFISKNDEILRGQCINIVLNKLSYSQLDNKEFRLKAYALSLNMFDELKEVLK